MANKKDDDLFISDSGVMVDKTRKKANIFVISCRVLSVILVILGIAAFIEGNF